MAQRRPRGSYTTVPHPANTESSRIERLSEVKDNHLDCKRKRHSFSGGTLGIWTHIEGKNVWDIETSKCTNCDMLKDDWYYNGQFIESQYDDSLTDGYYQRRSKTVDDPAPRKADFFHEYLERNKKRYSSRESLLNAAGLT